MIQLNKCYLIDIRELITQQIKSIQTNIIHISKLKNIGDYDLSDYTQYKVDDYLTIKERNKPKDINREILTDNNIGFID